MRDRVQKARGQQSKTQKPKRPPKTRLGTNPSQELRLLRFQEDCDRSRAVTSAFANFFELDDSHKRQAMAWHRSVQ